MANHHITFGPAMASGRPVIASNPRVAETLTANGTTGISALDGEVCRIATDTAIYVHIAATPSAGANKGYMLLANSVTEFGGVRAGDKVAVVAVT